MLAMANQRILDAPPDATIGQIEDAHGKPALEVQRDGSLGLDPHGREGSRRTSD